MQMLVERREVGGVRWMYGVYEELSGEGNEVVE